MLGRPILILILAIILAILGIILGIILALVTPLIIIIYSPGSVFSFFFGR
jgi:hypothetical protein